MSKRFGFQKFGLGFVKAQRSTVGILQDVVQRVGDAIIGGDFGGNARGLYALDFQIQRQENTFVASGERAIAIGSQNQAAGIRAVAIGYNVKVTGDFAVGLGAQVGVYAGGGVAVGYSCNAYNTYCVSLGVGCGNFVQGIGASSIGVFCQAIGARSIALGYYAVADDDDEAVIAGLVLKLQTAVGVKVPVLTAGVGDYFAMVGF